MGVILYLWIYFGYVHVKVGILCTTGSTIFSFVGCQLGCLLITWTVNLGKTVFFGGYTEGIICSVIS